MTTRRTITKKELVLRIAEHTQQKQTATRDIIQLFIDEVISELARGNRLELRDFGVFEVKLRRARKARNPKTGDEVRVPEKRVVTIKPGKKMKEQINRHAEAQRAGRALLTLPEHTEYEDDTDFADLTDIRDLTEEAGR